MKRLMFFLLAALIGFAAANAQVTQGRVGNGDITIYGTDWTDVYGLDFDNDGTLEFRISDFDGGGWDPSITNGYLSYDWTDGGNNIASQTDYVEFVASGVTIGASSEFGGYGDGMIESSALTAGTYYLGFRFVLNDGVHYGYAECTVVENGTDFDITWNNCYYNATVSGSIITGETGGGSGVDPCLKSIPFTENFEGISSGLPECWSQIASYESRAKWNFSASGHTGNCVYFDDWYGENSRLILPAVDCSSLAGGAQMSFYFKNPITSNSVNITYDVYYRTSSTGDWTIISDASVTDANADWTIAEFSLPSSANTPYYQVSILATGADTYSTKPALYIDDIEISAPSSCPRPSGLTATPTDNSFALSWTENGTATAWQVKIGDGEWIDVNTTPSYNATGLNANTEYTISLRANCGGEQSGEITSTFRTICSAETVPYTEDFESLTAGIPTCWEQEATNEGRSKWGYTGSGHEGNGIAFSDYWAESSRLILPVVDCSSLANGAQLTFFYKNPTSGGNNASASLYYRTSSTGEWTAISAWSLTDATNYWTEAEVALPNSSNAAYYQLSFYTTGVNASSKVWIYLDDIHIEAASDCQRPVSGSIDNVSITTADVEWDSVDGATEYKVAYGTTNDPEAATVVTSATNTKTLEGLHAATTYYVWVATVCGASQSTWRSVGNFTTDIACAQVIDAEVTNTAATAIALGWAIDTTVGYASTAVEVAYKEDGATEWITDITTENYYVFAGLTEGATYNFRITNICGTDSAFALELDASTAVCGELSGGSTVSYMPSRPYYGYSYSQAIYPASEVESFGDISGMSFYFNGTPSTRTVDVYITDMDDPSLANGFIDISEFTPVATDYSWSIASGDWSEITFDAPFNHQSGKSIVIALYDKTGSYAGTYSDGFRCHSGSGRYMHNDYSTYDLADPDDGTSATVVPNIRFNTTCNTTCQAPIVVLASVAQHEATVVWTPLGTETSWVAEYRVFGESNWTVAEDEITGTSTYTFANLLAGTHYELRIGAICGEDRAYGNVTAYTECGWVDVPYTEDFNSGELNHCWVVGTNAPYINEGRLYNYYYTDGFAILPQFSSPINTLRINFDAEYTGYSTGTVQVGVVSDNSGIESFELVETLTLTTDLVRYEVLFSNYTGTGNNIAIKLPVGYVYIDSLVVSPIPSCLAPTALTIDATTPTTADISWTHDATNFEIRYRAAGGEWQTTTSETTSVSLTGLTPETTYEVAVRAICTSSDSSETLTGTFTTEIACAQVTGLAMTAATINSLTIGWGINANIGYASTAVQVSYKESDASEWTDTITTSNTFTLEGLAEGTSYDFRVRNICGNDSATSNSALKVMLESNVVSLDTSQATDVASFEVIADCIVDTIRGISYYYNGTNSPSRTIDVYIADVSNASLTGGCLDISQFTQVNTTYIWEVTNGWSEIVFDNEFVHQSGNDIVIAIDDNSGTDNGYNSFRGHSGSGYSYYQDGGNIDPLSPSANSSGARTAVADIRFTTNCGSAEQSATCDVPTSLAASNVTSNSATFSWNGIATQYEIEINGQTPVAATSPYNAQSLTAATAYSVRVRALCDGGLSSDWTDAVTFTTLDEGQQPTTCETPTGLAVNDITENSAVISWNDVELPATDDGFVGEWSLTMANNAQIHRTVTLDATLHTMLGYVGRDMDDVDEDASLADTPMPVTIEQGAGDQMNVSGSFSVELMTGLDPITFDFATTGTLSTNGLSIDPADLTQSITLMGLMPVNLTGTVTFVQPTALPENGVLTLEIASLDVDGSGTYMGGTATMSIDGTSLQASGTKEATTSEYPKYELVITNAGTNTETAVSDATSPYTAENLTASTAYTVKVRTLCDENTTSDWSAAVPFTTLDSQQPETCDVPTNLAANNVTENSAIISWTGNAPQYEVETNGQTTTVSTNSYNTQGLTAATTYSVRVRALCDNGLTSNWTTAISFTTLNGGDEPEPCATPVNVTVANITTNSAVVSWSAGSTTETFDGEWNLELAETDSVHMVITPDQGMHTMLQIAGYDIDDVDENVSVAGTMVPVTIEPSTGNQMNISGSFDMDMYGVDEPVTFHFATTGTVSNNTLTIAPANINETVLIMGAMPIDYTGTVTFVQPTALPVGGNLTIGIASLDISGYGDTTVAMGAYTMTGSVTISMTGSNLTATGPRVGETNDNQNYELVVTNTAIPPPAPTLSRPSPLRLTILSRYVPFAMPTAPVIGLPRFHSSLSMRVSSPKPAMRLPDLRLQVSPTARPSSRGTDPPASIWLNSTARLSQFPPAHTPHRVSHPRLPTVCVSVPSAIMDLPATGPPRSRLLPPTAVDSRLTPAIYQTYWQHQT